MESSPLLSKHNFISVQDEVSSRIVLDPAAARAQRKLQLACLCSVLFMFAEVVGGFYAGSLSIMTDAAHLLSDVAGFLISLFAIWIGSLPASSRMSYGFQRAEVLGAILSVLFIWVLTGVLVYAAVERLIEDLGPNPVERVNGKVMFGVALIGLFVNLLLMKILGHHHHHGGGHHHGHSHSHDDVKKENDVEHGHTHGNGHTHDHHGDGNGNHSHNHSHGHVHHTSHDHSSAGHDHSHHENINIQAAYIHALGDMVQSVGVCIAGALIWYEPKWQIADPIATFLFSILVLITTVDVIKQSVHVLMEGTPDGIDPIEIEAGLRALSSVLTTHDLHIWSLTIGKPSLSVHVVSETPDAALHEAQDYLISKGISHSTIQVEKGAVTYPQNCLERPCGSLSPRG